MQKAWKQERKEGNTSGYESERIVKNLTWDINEVHRVRVGVGVGVGVADDLAFRSSDIRLPTSLRHSEEGR